MTLAGANNFSENNDNTIYTINSPQNGQYCAIIPKNTDGEISMLVDMNMKEDFDALVSNNITKDSLVEKLNKEYTNVKSNYPSGILVIPMTDISNLTNAVNSNDKQKIFDETKKIGGITSELYKNLIESGLEKSKINQKIKIIEKTDIDTKFVNWLKEQMPNFVDGIKLDKKEEVANNNNPFANVNPFSSENESKQELPKTIEETPSTSAIAVEQNNNVSNLEPPKPVVDEQITTPVSTPSIEPAIEENNNITNTAPSEPVKVEQPKEAENIQPSNSIQNTETNNNLITPSPIPEQKETNQEISLERKSRGFANLLILLVVLVVVTIVSIELGKFLFNTFGA